jgi:hypothetical protein
VLSSPIPLEIELLIVDDCSTDGSWDLIVELAQNDRRIKAIRHGTNAGKGSAIRTAIKHMTGDVAVVQDADLEYDPHEFPALLAPILDGKADAVFGSRYASPTRRVPRYWHTQVNQALTLCSNLLTGLALTDMETCYKVVRADILRQLRLASASFTFEPELTSRLAQWGARIYEVPISYAGRGFDEGKKIRPFDGLKAIGQLLYCRFIDRRCCVDASFDLLKACDRLRACQRWLYEQIHEFVGRRVLHLHCGFGGMSSFFLDKEAVILAESEPNRAQRLERRFARRENLSFERGSLADHFDVDRWRAHGIDTIFWADWLGEASSDPPFARFENILAAGGHCILFTPACSALGRANPASLLSSAGLEIAVVKRVGRLPRWLSSRWPGLVGQPGARRLYWLARWLPLARYTDRWFTGGEAFQIVVARKRQAAVERIAA